MIKVPAVEAAGTSFTMIQVYIQRADGSIEGPMPVRQAQALVGPDERIINEQRAEQLRQPASAVRRSGSHRHARSTHVSVRIPPEVAAWYEGRGGGSLSAGLIETARAGGCVIAPPPVPPVVAAAREAARTRYESGRILAMASPWQVEQLAADDYAAWLGDARRRPENHRRWMAAYWRCVEALRAAEAVSP